MKKVKILVTALVLGLALFTQTYVQSMQVAQPITREHLGKILVRFRWLGQEERIDHLLFESKHLAHPKLVHYFNGDVLTALLSYQDRTVTTFLDDAQQIPVVMTYAEFLTLMGKDPARVEQYCDSGVQPSIRRTVELPAGVTVQDVQTHMQRMNSGKSDCVQCQRTGCALKCDICKRAYYCSTQCRNQNQRIHMLVCSHNL